MLKTHKTRVAVLYGGKSVEHEVSIRSAANVIENLDPARYEVVPIGIDKKGNWYLGRDIFQHSLAKQTVSQIEHQTTTWFTPEWIGKPVSQENNHAFADTKHLFDVVFPVVHGTSCEDGTLQGLLDLANLPYVGSGVLSSAICMDKDISKRIAILAGIAVAPYIVLRKSNYRNNINNTLSQVEKDIGYPVFVKPANAGSSVGIKKAKSSAELNDAIKYAFRYDTKIIIEKALKIREIEVAVLESLNDNEEPIVGFTGEIKPHHEFYSYEAKYLDENGADLIIPADITENLQKEINQIAKKLFVALECAGLARVDLFIEEVTNKIYFNEINTLPGFTEISMYPKLMSASGISYPALLTHLVELALQKHSEKQALVCSFEG